MHAHQNHRIRNAFLFLIAGVVAVVTAHAQEPGQEEEKLDAIIILDRSGSMLKTDRNDLCLAAAAFLVEQISMVGRDNRVAVIPFGNQAYVLGQEKVDPARSLTQDKESLVEMLNIALKQGEIELRENTPSNKTGFLKLLREQLTVNGQNATDLEPALLLARDIFRMQSDDTRRRMIILLSDGVPEPNLNDPERARTLAQREEGASVQKVLGQMSSGRKPDQSILNKIISAYGAHILSVVVPELRDAHIPIYPVVVHEHGISPAAAVEYLRQIQMMTSGSEDILSVEPDDLIRKLSEVLPSTSNHVRYHVDEHFVGSATSSKTLTVTLPEFALESRILVSYKSSRPSQNPGIRIMTNGEKLFDSKDGIISSDVAYTAFSTAGKSIIYQSVRIRNERKASGTLKIDLTDESTGKVEYLPEAEVIVDFRADFNFRLELTPENPPARSSLEIRAKLFSLKDGALAPISISQATMKFQGITPDEIAGLSCQVSNMAYVNSVAIGKAATGVEKPGEYLLRLGLWFPVPDQRVHPRPVSFTRYVRFGPPTPLYGNAWIARKRDEPAPNFEWTLDLPQAGDETVVSSPPLFVKTILEQPIPSLQIKIEPLHHEISGQMLGSMYSGWCIAKPKDVLNLTSANPVSFNILLAFPNAIPENLPDGTYKGMARLSDGVNSLHPVPVQVVLRIPRLVDDPKKAKELLNPQIAPDTIRLSKRVYAPGDYDRKYELELWSTARASNTTAHVTFFDARGEWTDSSTSTVIRREEVRFVPAGDSQFQPASNESSSPGSIDIFVQIKDSEGLNGQIFRNVAIVQADKHRSLPVQFDLIVDFVSPQLLRLIYAFLGIGAALLLYWAWRIWQHRTLFEGRRRHVSLTPASPLEVLLSTLRPEMGGFRYNGRALGQARRSPVARGQGNIEFYVGAGWALEVRRLDAEELDELPEGRFLPQAGESMRLRHRREIYEITVDGIPQDDQRNLLEWTIRRSPFSVTRFRLIAVIGLSMFGLSVYGLLINPYFVLQLLNL